MDGYTALQKLVDKALRTGETTSTGQLASPWEAAERTVRGADPDVARAALAYLLATRLIDRQTEHPLVAARKIARDDVIAVDGRLERVTGVRHTKGFVEITVRQADAVLGAVSLLNFRPDFHLPLVERPARPIPNS